MTSLSLTQTIGIQNIVIFNMFSSKVGFGVLRSECNSLLLQEGLGIYRRAWVFTGGPGYLQEGLDVERFCLSMYTFKMYHIKM